MFPDDFLYLAIAATGISLQQPCLSATPGDGRLVRIKGWIVGAYPPQILRTFISNNIVLFHTTGVPVSKPK